MWTYDQSSGHLSQDDALIATGYSGAADGKNNPSMQAAVNVGPIPAGQWTMTGVEEGGPTGPFTIVLAPCEGTDTEGRTAFRIHGDSIAHPGEASHGCIILPQSARRQMWNSGDHDLTVVA